MSAKEDYIKQAEKQMDDYQQKMDKVDNILKNYTPSNKEGLLAQRDDLKEKFDQAQQTLQKVKSASEDKYEDVKKNSVEAFNQIKDVLHDFSNAFVLDELSRAKEQVMEFSGEKLEEIEDVIKKHPLTVAIWALGIGFIVGTFLTRSK